MRTADLIGPALDYAVILTQFPRAFESKPSIKNVVVNYPYSTDWAQGGPIIERERISTVPLHHDWEATLDLGEGDSMVCTQTGRTALVAAMRCLVASLLGDEIDIPKELT